MAENNVTAGGVRVLVGRSKVYEGPELGEAFAAVDRAMDTREFWASLLKDAQDICALGLFMGGLLR